MNFLSIDCSTDIGSLFVKIENKTFSKILQSHKFNNDVFMKKIIDFFEEKNINFNDLSHILVNQGPGNFSGLRGSLATAKGISLSKNLQLFGYNTFLWSCVKFINNKNSVYSLLQFRDKYFVKKFDSNLTISSNVREVTKDEIIINYKDAFKVVVSDTTKYFDDKILKLNNLNIVELDHNELEFLKKKGLLDKDLIKPLYLS